MFCRPESFSTVPRASHPIFIFSIHRYIFGSTEGVGSRFRVLRSRTRYQRFRGHRVPFSCFALSDSFSAVPSASRPVFMFSAPRHVFGDTEGVGSNFHVWRSRSRFRRHRRRRSCFHVLCARTRFRWYRGRRVSFSCFARPDSFSTVPRATHPIFIFSAPILIFGGTEVVGSRFHVLCSRTRFRRYRGRKVLFHVLRSRTHFRRYRRRRVLFSCFARPDSFSAVPKVSGPVFMFCTPGLVSCVTVGVGFRLHVLRALTHFRRYRGRQIPFSCFPHPDMFLAVPMASGPFFMFCASELVFNGIEGVGSCFHVLRSRNRFRRCRVRRVPFSCFALSDTFSAVTRASGPVFLFRAP
jgi:hypothetical protein